MKMLSKIQRGRTPRPPRLLVYGTPGIGKSTFAAHALSPVFLPTEDGLDEIECDKFPLARTLADVTAALDDLRTQSHDYETIVIDTLDWLERIIWDRVCAEYGVRSIEHADGGYARGYTHALTHWRDIITQLDQLRVKKNMVVLLIAHAKVERFEDPEATAYDRYSPRLHKHATSLITEWCDAVLFATRRIRTQTEDAGFGRTRAIAHAIGKDGGERILRTIGGPSCVAKNRYGLTEELPLSWSAFMDALSRRISNSPPTTLAESQPITPDEDALREAWQRVLKCVEKHITDGVISSTEWDRLCLETLGMEDVSTPTEEHISRAWQWISDRTAQRT